MDGRQVSRSVEEAKVDNPGAGEVSADSVHGFFSPWSECSGCLPPEASIIVVRYIWCCVSRSHYL
jgi:hypothetical protein